MYLFTRFNLISPLVHAEGQNKIHEILRIFDLCVQHLSSVVTTILTVLKII